MIDFFDSIDKTLLLLLNGNGNVYWDQIMWIYTGRIVWIPVVLAFLWYFIRKGGWREALMVLIFIALLITLCDQISSGFCKPFFERLRPSHQDDLSSMLTLVNGYRGGRYGFISSHAANSFGFAMFTAMLIRKPIYTVTIFIWAMMNSYSRIYLGVHFPGDILAGTILGVVLGYLVYQLYSTLHYYLFVSLRFKTPGVPYEKQTPRIVLAVLYTIFLLLLIFPSTLYPFFLKH